jgi:DNA polymerase III delta subunit
MLYVFLGDDRQKNVSDMHRLKSEILKDIPDLDEYYLEGGETGVSEVQFFLQGTDLFSKKRLVVLDNFSGNIEPWNFLLENAKEYKNSEHIFIVLDEIVDPLVTKTFTTHAEKVSVARQPLERELFTIFSLADAVASRNKKQAWIEYQKAVLSGKSAEEIHGTLFWQIKALMLASKSKTANEAGMKPYPFSKAQQASKKFSQDELTNKLETLLEVYHESRMGKRNLDLALEEFVLKV